MAKSDETKLRQIAGSNEKAAARIVVDGADGKKLKVRLVTVLPNSNTLASTVDEALEKLMKKKRAPTLTDEHYADIEEVKARLESDEYGSQLG